MLIKVCDCIYKKKTVVFIIDFVKIYPFIFPGIVGVRMDGIEDVKINNVVINKLFNKSPLGTCACDAELDAYPNEGDVRGISVIGGDLQVEGVNNIMDLTSEYGNVTGIDVMDKGFVMFDDEAIMNIKILDAQQLQGDQCPNIRARCIKINETGIVIGANDVGDLSKDCSLCTI